MNERSLSRIFDHCIVETRPMCWHKRDIWRKAGVTIAGMLLLLALMIWVPVSAAGAYERAAGFAGPVTVTVQTTPTVDATVTALNKEKLAQEVQQLKNQNASDLFGWLRTNSAILLSTLVVVIGGLIGLFRWFGDRRSEREKQAEERFQAAVTGLGDEKEGAKIGAAILLRTFLRPGYEQFYTQTFDLAVANLRLPRALHSPDDPDGLLHPADDINTPWPLTTLSKALIVVFKEAFPLARSQNKGSPQSLDATDVCLDHAYLSGADLERAWMSRAPFRRADLHRANLRSAHLHSADLSFADLSFADLSFADLHQATLTSADLRFADLTEADLTEADLSRANLYEANLSRVEIKDAILKDTELHKVHGLTKEQLATCKAKGAIIDEDSKTSSSQSTVSPSLPSHSNNAQAPSVPFTQGSNPTPETDESNTPSSKPSPEP
jgi:uncharacterized protein YjbI with pentapeptide repeats